MIGLTLKLLGGAPMAAAAWVTLIGAGAAGPGIIGVGFGCVISVIFRVRVADGESVRNYVDCTHCGGTPLSARDNVPSSSCTPFRFCVRVSLVTYQSAQRPWTPVASAPSAIRIGINALLIFAVTSACWPASDG